VIWDVQPDTHPPGEVGHIWYSPSMP
jgi:hypothetical protein